LAQLGELFAKTQDLLDKDPTNLTIQAALKQISSRQTQIMQLLRDLAVVEVSPSTLTEMQQLEDTIAASIVSLQARIDLYNKMSTSSTGDMQRQLSDSLKILSDFSVARRKYISSQRLYESTMRAASSQKFHTAEQEEMQDTFERISNTYQQLGIVAEQLQTELNSLEDQLNTILK
ncbi:MAG TPA: hypothetical protein PKM25_06825, partial [Candidatus Ozemobacteraceae bacterium]|nr:hypothetical protein [Candidatus Ozemobacteraceae bacterium]